MTFILLLIGMSISCIKIDDIHLFDPVELFKAESYSQILMAHQMKVEASKHFGDKKTVDRPSGVWKLLLSVVHDAQRGDEFLNRTCLFYRVPFVGQRRWGELKMITIPNERKCDDELVIFRQANLGPIKDLYVHFSPESEVFQQDKVPAFNLALSFNFFDKKDWKKRRLVFPLANIRLDQIEGMEITLDTYRRERFESGERYSAVPSLQIRHFNPVARPLAFWYAGKMDDRFEKGLYKCHQVDDKCNVIHSYECDRCKFGFFDAAHSKCKKAGIKFCGTNRCGGKGMPACPRGFQHSKILVTGDCFNGSPAGFCQTGLQTYCNEDQILICL